MKKIITLIICVAIIGTMSIALVGCGDNQTFNSLSRAFNAVAETSTSIDNVDNNDLKSIGTNFMVENEELCLSTAYMLAAGEHTTKVQEALALHEAIKAKTELIETGKSELKAKIDEIKDMIQALKAAGATVTEEEKVLIKAYIEEIKTINETLKGTIGKAYKRMYDLRGQYTLANVDNVITTFTEVDEVLGVRITNLDRLNEIADEVKVLLESKSVA